MKSTNELFDWYRKLTKESLQEIDNYYAADVFFKDPFNEINGREKVKTIFRDMFEHLVDPHFELHDIIVEGQQAFATWDFVFSFKNKAYTIRGSSHFKFNGQMMVVYHRDYWDVGEELLLKLPFIKSLYSAFRKKMASV